MLHEHFLAATSHPPRLTASNATLLKDAGILLHSHQPSPGLRSTFKRSITQPNCLAVSTSHIFAAQSDKAVVHVYNRAKGNHEATVPFPERLRSVALVADGAVVVLGTDEGSVLLWETCTGRQVAAPQSHLQAVTVLAVDSSNTYLLSGSEDSNVLVWSLSDLLSFRGQSALAQHQSIAPRHTLAAHKSGIAALVVGQSATNSNIAVSASKDETAVVWDYRSGTRLRTFLLSTAPLCLALDPADRGFYAGYEDGSIQLVDFNASTFTSIRDATHASTPLQPPASSRWRPLNPEVGSSLSVALSYDTTTLLSGHASGKVLSWDVATGNFKAVVADYVGASITHLQFLQPTGFAGTRPPRLKANTVMKPRPHESFSGAKGRLSETYLVNIQFASKLPSNTLSPHSEFLQTLTAPTVPSALIASCITDLESPSSHTSAISSISLQPAEDHISLNIPDTPTPNQELEHLRKQIEHLKNLQRASSKHLKDLASETVTLRKKEAAWQERRQRKTDRRKESNDAEWEALKTKKMDPHAHARVNGNAKGKAKSTPTRKEVEERVIVGMDLDDPDEDELSGTTTPSEESESDDA